MSKMSIAQKLMMVEWLEQHENKCVLTGPSHILRPEFITKKWQELAIILNSCNSGPAKTGAKWRKTFNELRCNVKKKHKASIADVKGTKGRHPQGVPLSELDRRFFNLSRKNTIDDLTQTVQMKTSQPSTSTMLPTPESFSPLSTNVSIMEFKIEDSSSSSSFQDPLNDHNYAPTITEPASEVQTSQSTRRKRIKDNAEPLAKGDREIMETSQAEALNNVAAAINRLADGQQTMNKLLLMAIEKFLEKK